VSVLIVHLESTLLLSIQSITCKKVAQLSQKERAKYTVNHKRNILFLTITLANLDQFSEFLYHFYREEILHTKQCKIGGKLVLNTKKSYIGFQLVQKSMTLNVPVGVMDIILCYFAEFGSFRGQLCKSG